MSTDNLQSKRPSSAAIEAAGRAWLTAQLLLRGYEVATPFVDRGLDLLVFHENNGGVRAAGLQLKCSMGRSFTLDRKYAGRGILLAYVWNVLEDASVHFLTYDEALVVLGEKAQVSQSWSEGGAYSVTKVGSDLLERLTPFKERWSAIDAQLERLT